MAKLRHRRDRMIQLEGQIRGLMTAATELGIFLLPSDPKAWAIYDRKGGRIFPKTGGADLPDIARHFLTLPSSSPVDDWGDALE